MAGEITVNFSLNATKANTRFQENRNFTDDITGDLLSDEVLVTATTAAAGVAVTFTGLTQEKWAIFENTDTTDNILIGVQHSGTTFVELFQLGPSQSCIGPISSSASVYCQASANTPVLKARAIDNGA